MPLVKVLRSRGANVTVQAYGEVLFAPTGDVGRWTNRFSQRVRHFAAQEAPTNKRPRWAHYGKPLKATMRATTKYRPNEMRVYSAVGSVAPHGYYVDQGTGVHAGNGPYPAKILPPWTRGGGTLYEHTWRPGGGKGYSRRVLIKGQKGQGFLDKGVRHGFRVMRLAQGAYPDAAKITDVLNSEPEGLANFFGNTVADASFVAQLNEWRAWRDEAWNRAREAKRNAREAARTAKQVAQRAEAENRVKAENLARYRASKEAARQRALQQAAAIKAQRERIAEARKRKEEQEAKARAADRLQRGNRKMRRDALEFYNKIREAYPNATMRSTTLADGVVVYRVSYTLADGEVVRRDYAFGYSTG